VRCLIPFLLLLPDSAFALAEEKVSAMVNPLSSAYLIKFTAGLLVVVLLILLLAWLVKKFNINPQQQGPIKVIAGLSLGTRDRLVLVQLGHEQLLLALSPGRIEKIHQLAEPLVVDEMSASSSSFAEKFNQLLSDRKKQ
jgi:flagellar protein FliO/FliZ